MIIHVEVSIDATNGCLFWSIYDNKSNFQNYSVPQCIQSTTFVFVFIGNIHGHVIEELNETYLG